MFTGIVQTTGQIKQKQRQTAGVRLVVDHAGWQPDQLAIACGASICVSGVCLTVTAAEAQKLSFDVTAETLACSTLGALPCGSKVNLEPALTAATSMGGHFVQGHVDGVGKVTAIQTDGDDCRLSIAAPQDLIEYLVPKGSITVDGVSLTIARVEGELIELALIPTTLNVTTLGHLAAGSAVNLEADIISKTVVHWLRLRSGQSAPGEAAKPPLTLTDLHQSGFV
jgi:riboflavin synthase